MKKLMQKNYHHGFTLIEVLLVVVFSLLVSAGAFLMYQGLQVNHKVNVETKNMDEIRTGVKSLYGSSGNYDGISNQVLNDIKVIPQGMQTEGIPNSITNSFGRAVVVLPSNFSGSGISNAFSLVYLRVPENVCTKLVSMVGMQFLTVTVGSIMVKNAGHREIDIPLVSSACGAGSEVDIIFTAN